jgi:hypothetical protein
MANTPFKKITSREIYGADISGLQDLLGKIETVLNMLTTSATGHSLEAICDQSDPALHYRIYEGTIRNWLESPAPVVKRNGATVPPEEYTLFAAQGMVLFTVQQSPEDNITANFTYIKSESQTIKDLQSGLGELEIVDLWKYRFSGYYYASSMITAGALAATTTSANNLDAFPIIVPVEQAFDRIGVNVVSTPAGKLRLGIYADNNGKPGSRILDSGEIDVSSTGLKTATINITLEPGLYWLVKVQDNTPGLSGLNATDMFTIGLDSSLGIGTGWRRASYNYAALPDPFGTSLTFRTGGQVIIFLRKA